LEGKKVIPLEVRGFTRGFDIANLGALLGLMRAFRTCRREMKADPPDVAAAFGGYASVPGAAAAVSLGIPMVIHEQNVIPGLANRVLAPWARKLAVSFAPTLERYRGWSRKGVITGNPLLRKPERVGVEEARRHFDLDTERKTVAVVGGSQGAASLNRAVLEAIPMWKDRSDLQLIHSVGRDKYQEFKAEAAKVVSGELVYRAMEFVERMDLLYQAADLVVCRAGASTIAELAAAGCAAVLIPYPYATAAHQDANAGVLADEGAAVVIKDQDLDGHRLKEEVDGLLADEDGLASMQEAALRVGKPDAATRLAEVVISLA